MSDNTFQFDPEATALVRDTRILRLLHVLVGLEAGLTAKQVADQLGISPGEVTRSIATLQRVLHLSNPPARHGASGWEFTPEGRRLANDAKALLPHVARFAGRALATSRGRRGYLRLGCFNPAVSHFVADALGHLRRSGFGYEIALSPDMGYRRDISSRELLGQLPTTLDYAIVPMLRGDSVHQESETLYNWENLVVTSEDHPLRHVATVTPDAIMEHLDPPQGLLLSPRGFASREIVEHAFALARQPVISVLDNPEALTRYKLAVNGLGIAIISQDSMPAHAVSATHPWPVLKSGKGEDLVGQYVLAWTAPVPIDPGDHDTFVAAVRTASQRFAKSFRLSSSPDQTEDEPLM